MSSRGRTPARHPTEATLLAYASGSLGASHRFVVATHATQCEDCRAAIRAAEQIGGILLDGLEPTALQPEALGLCLAQLDAHVGAPFDAAAPLPRVGGLTLPVPLHGLRAGRLRWLAPGVRHAILFRDERGTLHLIRMRPDVALPQHSHGGLELACVLQGACHDENGPYRVGDVSETGDEDEAGREHLVVAAPPEDCVCIVAIAGRLRFRSRLTRLLQPFLPF